MLSLNAQPTSAIESAQANTEGSVRTFLEPPFYLHQMPLLRRGGGRGKRRQRGEGLSSNSANCHPMLLLAWTP
eukprot:207144-Chlamydomonas_euryale.AAC.5